MELIYSMRRKPLKCEPPNFENLSNPDVPRPLCTISSANIIAFSSPTELTDSDGETWGGHVYVCDMDTPWDSHKVTSTVHPISALEWDSEGKQLMVATTVGEVSVFGQKDYLLNEWTSLYTANFPGEHVIKAVFFSNGCRVLLTDKKAEALVQDRVQVLRTTPTVKGFGGVASPGVCVVTSSGVVGAVRGGGGTSAERMRGHRDRLVAAAIVAAHSGKLIIAAATASGDRVRCVCATVTSSTLLLQPLPTLCLSTPGVTSLSWCVRDEADTLLVSGRQASMWSLSERAHVVHKLLGTPQGNTTPTSKAETFTSLWWQQLCVWNLERSTVAAAATRSPANAVCLIVGKAHCNLLQRGQVITIPVVTSGGGETPTSVSPPKKAKYGHGAQSASRTGPSVVACAVSALGGVCALIDTAAQLHLYKLTGDTPIPVSLQHAVSMVEYSMVSGVDCLDIMLTLKPPAIEALYDRLTESFPRQPPAFQQYYYQSWLTIRCNLLRLIPTAQASYSNLVAFSSLCAVWCGCQLATRLDDRAEPALRAALDDCTMRDEKSLAALEARAEAGPIGGILELSPLRRLLRRAAHTARTCLSELHLRHKYNLHTDPSAVSLLRRIGAVSRAFPELQRPLARLALTHNYSHDFIEECAALTAQINAPRIWEALPRCNVSSPHEKPWPLYFEYGIEPESLKYNPEPPASQCDATPISAMDSIRYMYIGGGWRAARHRLCVRCGVLALAPAVAARQPLSRACDNRFHHTCRCGGKWTLRSNV